MDFVKSCCVVVRVCRRIWVKIRMGGDRNMKREESREPWTGVTGKTYGPISEQEYATRRSALHEEAAKLIEDYRQIASREAEDDQNQR